MYGYPLGAGRARGSLALWPFALRPARPTGKLSKAGAVHPAVYHPLEGPSVGRRGVKEFRAAEALALIAADRDHKVLVCPTCGSGDHRTEPEAWRPVVGPITLTCKSCSRCAVYLARGAPPSPEEPRKMMK
jgi:hypothetical protein